VHGIVRKQFPVLHEGASFLVKSTRMSQSCVRVNRDSYECMVLLQCLFGLDGCFAAAANRYGIVALVQVYDQFVFVCTCMQRFMS
jgi:hypothetical protein